MTKYLDQLVRELRHPLNDLWKLTLGPVMGAIRLEPTEKCLPSIGPGYPTNLLVTPPWHPLELPLAYRGARGRLPDTSWLHAAVPRDEAKELILAVSKATFWPLRDVWVMYHLLTPFHTNGHEREDESITIRAWLWVQLGFDRWQSWRALHISRQQYQPPVYRPNFWTEDAI